jgi:hypothetical protein
VAACERKPGWMKPGEAERIAAFLKIPLAELFKTYLAVDWWDNDDAPATFLLSPAIVGWNGTTFPYVARGRCVFLTADKRCQIHDVKPFECAVAWCGDGPVATSISAHKEAAQAWATPENQQQISDLLGDEPYAPEPEVDDLIGLLGMFGGGFRR